MLTNRPQTPIIERRELRLSLWSVGCRRRHHTRHRGGGGVNRMAIDVTMGTEPLVAGLDGYKYGFHMPEHEVFRAERGLSREVVAAISERKGEPQWMRDFRLRALEIFYRKPMPT